MGLRQIEFYRRKKGMLQSELASLVGVAQPQISFLENGKLTVGYSTLCNIAKALDYEKEPRTLLDVCE
jgi:transcriptional regulator with XRE-family HTH domain